MLSEMWSKATVTRTIRRLDFMVHEENMGIMFLKRILWLSSHRKCNANTSFSSCPNIHLYSDQAMSVCV